MTNSNNIKGLHRRAQSFLVIKRVKEFFENFLNKIKKALQELSLSNAEYRALEGDIEAQEKILEMWTRCLEADKQTEAKKRDSVNYSTKEDSRIAKSKRTSYNEFNTLAMRWAHSNKTAVGDTTIINRNGRNFVLIEATEEGYIELASGNYDRVRDINEQLYKESAVESRESFEEYRANKGTDRWDTVNAGDGGNGGRVNDSAGTEGLQSYSTGDNESLRTNSKESS